MNIIFNEEQNYNIFFRVCDAIFTSFVLAVPPGPPKDLHHTDVDRTEVWLVWNWPDRNGGSDITGFLVEYQEEGVRDWDEWKTVSIPESHVTGLEEGKTYRFRVRAENAIGLSRPDTTVPILCHEKLGETRQRKPLEVNYNSIILFVTSAMVQM